MDVVVLQQSHGSERYERRPLLTITSLAAWVFASALVVAVVLVLLWPDLLPTLEHRALLVRHPRTDRLPRPPPSPLQHQSQHLIRLALWARACSPPIR